MMHEECVERRTGAPACTFHYFYIYDLSFFKGKMEMRCPLANKVPFCPCMCALCSHIRYLTSSAGGSSYGSSSTNVCCNRMSRKGRPSPSTYLHHIPKSGKKKKKKKKGIKDNSNPQVKILKFYSVRSV
jgi:hypothetical protein